MFFDHKMLKRTRTFVDSFVRRLTNIWSVCFSSRKPVDSLCIETWFCCLHTWQWKCKIKLDRFKITMSRIERLPRLYSPFVNPLTTEERKWSEQHRSVYLVPSCVFWKGVRLYNRLLHCSLLNSCLKIFFSFTDLSVYFLCNSCINVRKSLRDLSTQ